MLYDHNHTSITFDVAHDNTSPGLAACTVDHHIMSSPKCCTYTHIKIWRKRMSREVNSILRDQHDAVISELRVIANKMSNKLTRVPMMLTFEYKLCSYYICREFGCFGLCH